jgi:prepilin-type N-terminal cleavage/methylation domain-containing protein
VDRRKQGFSLIETMIAILVLSLVALMFYSGVQSARNEITFGAEHFTALLLTQKVLEDCIQEMEVNPNGLGTLGLDNNDPAAVSIVDGGSVFFTNLEDRTPPWRKIEGGAGEHLDENFGPLYAQSKDFKIKANAVRLTTDSNMSQVNVEISWKTKVGKGIMPMNCLVYSPVLPKKTSAAFTVDPALLERFICRRLFLCPPMSMPTIVSTYGGDPQTIETYGKLAYGVESLLQSTYYLKTMMLLDKNEKTIQSLMGSPKTKTFYTLVNTVASDNYQIARLAFNSLLTLQPYVEKAINEYDGSHLGPYLWEPKNRHYASSCLKEYMTIANLFVERLFFAKNYYEMLIQKDLAEFQDTRRLQLNLIRVMDLYKILFLIPSSPIQETQFVKFFRHVKEFAGGRNPALVRLAQQTIEFSADKQVLLNRNPNLKPVFEVIGKLPDYAAFIDPLSY